MKRERKTKVSGVALGDHVVDKVTGFDGVAMGICAYWTGCDQVLVVPTKMNKDGELIDGAWFDIERLESQGSKLTLPNVREEGTGGPSTMTAPTRNR